MRYSLSAFSGRVLVSLLPLALMAATPAQPQMNARTQAIDSALKSKDPDKVTEGFADLRRWFDQSPILAEHALYLTRPSLLAHPEHSAELLEMLDLAIDVKVKSKDGREGYLYMIKARILADQQKFDESLAAAHKALSGMDRSAIAVDGLAQLPKAFLAQKKYDELLDLLTQLVIAAPDNAALVETGIRQRVAIEILQGKPADALVDAKLLFNVVPIERAADALKLVEKQLTLAHPDDPSLVAQFKKEQLEGAKAPEGGAKASKSEIMLGIKATNPAFDDAAKKIDDKTFDDLIRHAELLLLADRPSDAAAKAEQAFVTAADPTQSKTAITMVARCYKAEDGTIGRAKTWLAAQVP